MRFWIVLLLALALYLIAASIGSGWLFLMCSALIAVLCAAACIPMLVLRNLKVAQRVQSVVSAGESFGVQILLARSAGEHGSPLTRFFGLFSVKPQFIVIEVLNKHKNKLEKRATDRVLVESFDKETSLSCVGSALPRGLQPAPAVSISTSFPLGLVWFQRLFPSGETVTVYPRIIRMEGTFVYRLRAMGEGLSDAPRENASAQSIHTRSIREYVRGDSPRNIHWSSTARTGRLMVREFDAEGVPRFDVFLDLAAKWSSSEQFELAVSAAASLLDLGHRTGLEPQLRLNPALPQLSLHLPTVQSIYDAQMEILARVMPVSDSSLGLSVEPAFGGDSTNVVICPRGFERFELPDSFQVSIGGGATEESQLRIALDRAVLIDSLEDLSRL